MDKQELIHRRKKRYMAQLLDYYEDVIENFVPVTESEEFKAMVRRKMNAVAVDACDILGLDGEEVNGYSLAIQDRVFPDGRKTTARS